MPVSLDISKLTAEEKLRLVSELWDSLDEAADVSLSDEQLTEIRRRFNSTDANPDALVSDAEMRHRLGWTD